MLVSVFVSLMKRRPPRSTRTDTLFPYTTLCRSELVLARPLAQGGAPALEVFVYAPDSDGLFAAVVATLDRFGLSILASRIVNAHNGMSLDTFQVLAVNDRGVGRDELARTVSRRLGDILTRPLSQVRPSRRALPRHLRH